ncbi:MAG: TIGR02678 family protein [Firmicutes bacterium]|nr:TIGR02678 family protein [Bacillota bacterium]
MDEKTGYGFDELAMEAAGYLLEQFWILREGEPEKYQMVREREPVLRAYFLEKLGFHLIVHRRFAKLEKLPARPEAWMGIQDFQHTRDYVLFCCLLAFLENKAVDEQFLMSELCEELEGLYPPGESLDWTHYEHRRSLVRVLLLATEVGILQVVEGDVAEFGNREDYEVLYEVPAVSRYFMRPLDADLLVARDQDALLQPQHEQSDAEVGEWRRHRVYRQLLLSPAMYRWDTNDSDFLYLRNYRHRIREDIESHTEYQFELYKNVALLTMPERRARFTLFPDNRAISDIGLQFAAMVRKLVDEAGLSVDDEGRIRLTSVDFEDLVLRCWEQYGHGWSKQYREGLVTATARDLEELLANWKMLSRDAETGTLFLMPLLGRTVGEYPADYMASD